MTTIPEWPQRDNLRRPKEAQPQRWQGYRAILITEMPDGTTHFRLLNGQFDTKDEADKYGREYASDCRAATFHRQIAYRHIIAFEATTR